MTGIAGGTHVALSEAVGGEPEQRVGRPEGSSAPQTRPMFRAGTDALFPQGESYPTAS